MRLYTHTHTHTRDLLTKKKRNKSKKRKGGEPIVIKLNLSLTIIKTILMIVIISLIIAQATLTIIKTNKQKDLVANQESEEKVKYVVSKKIDENREEVLDNENNPIDDTRSVPVPAGYTASQVPGERSIDTGFVIYEGDINWAEHIDKDDLYNSNKGVEKPVKINIPEETSGNQWIELRNVGIEGIIDTTYVSGYVDDVGIKHGNYHKDNIENKLSSKEFTLEQSEILIIKWAVSSEVEDKLYYNIKNVETGEIIGGEKTAISGTANGTNIDELIYTDTEVSLDAGTYEIEFVYSKNGSISEGLDAGFVKSIERKIQEVDYLPEVKFTIPEGDGTTENNHHWLQYEDGTYVSGYTDETGNTYGNYHVANSKNILTSEEFTIEREARLEFDWALSAEGYVLEYGIYYYLDYLYCTITNKETGEEIWKDEMGQNGNGTYESSEFETRGCNISAGTYIISFIYEKNDSQDYGLDAGFIKNVRLETNKSTYIDIDFKEGIYHGGEYEEGVWSTGYIKEDILYGNYNIISSISILETEEITLEGATTLKFEWSVSSYFDDYLYYKIINIKTNQVVNEGGISGTTRGTTYDELKYEEKTFYLEPGTYKIKYEYRKCPFEWENKGLDAGFVKNIRTVQTSTQTELNIFNLQKSTNQYVWVPISEEELNNIYGVDRNGKLWGKLYDSYNPTTTHSKSGNNWTTLDDGSINITDPTSYREPDVTRYIPTSNGYSHDLDSQLPKELTGETRYELLSRELEQDFYKTIESIKKYGGFYIGRYETGGTGKVVKMDYNTSSNSWYQLYKKCDILKGENNNVRTSMIWGSLWDATFRWFIASGETASDGVKINNNYLTNCNYAKYLGNYGYSEFNYIATNATGPLYDQNKAYNAYTKVATGSTEHTNINNIYDMAGNNFEFTLEAYSTDSRVLRGSSCGSHYYLNYPSNRNSSSPSSTYSSYTARSILYIE